MATAQDLIERALRRINALGSGSILPSNEAQDGLEALNAMLASWSVEGAYVFTESKETFNLTGAASYTIGSGGDFNTTRPMYFTAAYVSSGNTDYPLRQITNREYANIAQKQIATITNSYYYDAGFPLGTIYLYPVPSGVTTITLYSFKPLTGFSGLTTTFSMPPEYEAAIVNNLAVWLAPEYEKEASRTVMMLAHETKQAVLTQNQRNERYVLTSDYPGTRQRDEGSIYKGWYN